MSNATNKQIISRASQGQTLHAERSSPLRFVIFVTAVVLLLSIILVQSASIHLSGKQWDQVEITRGEGSSMVLEAPRGDIVDRSGKTLAYSEYTDSLYLAYSGLNSSELNRMLLDLSRTLEEHGVNAETNLPLYLDWSSDSKQRADRSKPDYVFKRDLDVILAWQQNRDLFALLPSDSKKTGMKVMQDPNEFYRYLLYEKFEIEDGKARGNFYYSPDEQWQIMQLRYQILEHNWTFAQGEPVLIALRIPESLKALIHEQGDRFPGAVIKRESRRRYTDDSRYFSHIMGYVGAISANEYESLKSYGYGLNDITGKAGVEYSAERYLHGTNGRAPYGHWDSSGDGAVFREGSGGVPPVPGATVRLTQDVKLQKVLYASLYDTVEYVRESELGNGKSAAAVMIDLANGQVLAMGSIPSYVSTDFTSAAYDEAARERVLDSLTDTIRKPMQNRCISEIYAPGSTFKPVSAAAAIMNHVIDPIANSYECKGKDYIGYKNWVCFGEPDRGHGMITLDEALMYSCNLYFFKMSLDTGIEAISRTAKNLGLGEYTGIDLPGEAKGIRPSPELKYETRLIAQDKEWYPADTCQTSIGQFDNAYTLLQLVRAIGAAGTNRLVVPHVIYDIRSADGQIIRPEQIEIHEAGLNDTSVSMVRSGMSMLKHYQKSNHTYANFQEYPIDVSAKTGTAEVGYDEMSTNALFVCFAPTENPSVAIACIVEGGGKGDVTSNIARDLLDAWFGYEPRPEIVKRLKEMEADPNPFFHNEGYVPDTPVATPDAAAGAGR